MSFHTPCSSVPSRRLLPLHPARSSLWYRLRVLPHAVPSVPPMLSRALPGSSMLFRALPCLSVPSVPSVIICDLPFWKKRMQEGDRDRRDLRLNRGLPGCRHPLQRPARDGESGNTRPPPLRHSLHHVGPSFRPYTASKHPSKRGEEGKKKKHSKLARARTETAVRPLCGRLARVRNTSCRTLGDLHREADPALLSRLCYYIVILAAKWPKRASDRPKRARPPPTPGDGCACAKIRREHLEK